MILEAPAIGRTLDMAALLAQDAAPIPWAVDHLAARGHLTTLVGAPGIGKSWLALLLAAATHNGSSVGGLACQQGRALYLDGENGEAVAVQRYRAAGLDPDAMIYVDGHGVDLAKAADRDTLAEVVIDNDVTLLVLDSLKRLTPTARENENDQMAPVIGGLSRLARDTDAAVLLLHHRGKGGREGFRGASAIEDQTDVLVYLSGSTKRLTLNAGKFRIGPEPDERFMALREDDAGRLRMLPEGGLTKEVMLAERIREHAETIRENGGWGKKRIAEAIGEKPTNGTLTRALDILRAEHGWTRQGGGRSTVHLPPAEE